MKAHNLTLTLASASVLAAGNLVLAADAAKVTVDLDQVQAEISPNIYGTGMEDVNHEIYGGLDAQRLYGESFEELPKPRDSETPECRGRVSRCWTSLSMWEIGELVHDRTKAHGGEYSQLMIPNGAYAAMANAGLGNTGIAVREGRAMIGHIYACGAVDELVVEMQSNDRKRTLGRALLNPAPGENWQRLDFCMKITGTDPKARFIITAHGFGRLWVDDAYLADEPTNEFGRIGCREDVVAGLQQMGVNFLRWGGTMCNAEDYKLKNFGPDRKPYRGFWHHHSSGGFGPREFVRLAGAMKVPCAFSISTREDIADAVRLAEDLKAYDHPIIVQIGNEECYSRVPAVCRRYCDLAVPLVKAMRAANPKLQFATAAWWMGRCKTAEEIFRRLDGVVDFWDLHPFFTSIGQALSARTIVQNFMTTIRQWNPKTTMRAAIFEENGSKHNLDRALCHALMLEKVREAGKDVLTSCPANAFQVWKQNDNNWDQGNVFMTPDKVWLAPCGWAQRMARDGHRELSVKASSDDDQVHVSAVRDREGASPVLHLVNIAATEKPLVLDFGKDKALTIKSVRVLSGATLAADNTPTEPLKVAPVEQQLPADGKLVLRPYSYTVVTFGK